MIVTLTFKQPDVLDQIDDDIADADECQKAKEIARKYVEYDEYVYIDIDTVAGTAVVRKV